MKKPSRKINQDMVKAIKELLATKQYYRHQIAALFGINQGRISEVKTVFTVNKMAGISETGIPAFYAYLPQIRPSRFYLFFHCPNWDSSKHR